MIYLQTAQTLADFIYLSGKVTNAIDAEIITHTAARVIGDNSSAWKRDFFSTHFSRFAKSKCYRILMGEEAPNHREYNYVPNPF